MSTRILGKYLVTLFAVVGIAGFVRAAQPDKTAPTSSGTTDKSIDKMGAASQRSASDLGATTGFRSTGYQPVRSHQFLGMHVADSAGKDVGEVKEIVFDSSRQRVDCALISADRSLDLGGRYLAVPWTALDIQSRQNSDKAHLVINMDREQLKSGPSIDKDRWSEIDSSGLRQQIDQFYQHTTMEGMPSSDLMRETRDTARDFGQGVSESARDIGRDVSESARDIDRDLGTRPSREVDRDIYSGDYAGTAERDASRRDIGAAADDKAFDSRRLSKVVGMDINQNNEKVGGIKDVVIDNSNGSVLYALCELNRNVEGASGKWCALPWTLLSPGADDKSFAVNADRETLGAVAYDKATLPLLLNDRSFAMSISDRFNIPGAVYGFVGEAPSAADLSTVSGTIDAIDAVNEGGFKDSLHLKVNTDAGQQIWVYAGPKSYLEKQQLSFKKGDRIDVTGTKTVIDGNSVMLAHDVTMGSKIVHLRDAQGSPLWMGGQELKHDMDSTKFPSTTPAPETPSRDEGSRSY